jgi:hypothetical protein
MPILRLLQNGAFGPEAVEALSISFDNACRDLGLVDRADPITELLARKIIEVAQTGERDPTIIQQQAIALLGASRKPDSVEGQNV